MALKAELGTGGGNIGGGGREKGECGGAADEGRKGPVFQNTGDGVGDGRPPNGGESIGGGVENMGRLEGYVGA